MRRLRARPTAYLLTALLAFGVVACGDDGPTNGITNSGTGDPSSDDEPTSTLLNDDGPQTTGSVATPDTEAPSGTDPSSGSVVPSDG